MPAIDLRGQGDGEQRRVGLGTAAFTMQDVLLEPYGGEILGLSVGATTMLTALVVFGVDLPIDWLVFLAMLCGAFAMALVEGLLRRTQIPSTSSG